VGLSRRAEAISEGSQARAVMYRDQCCLKHHVPQGTTSYDPAGIKGASSHSGRRQFLTELADKGVNARVIQALARHKHLNTTMRYIDIQENKFPNAIELGSGPIDLLEAAVAA
jgi:hypothetical protein